MLNLIFWNRTDYLYKVDLALNNLQRLICHKTQPTNKILINPSTIFWVVMSSIMSIDCLYSFTSSLNKFNHFLMNILLIALICTHAFSVKVFDTQWYTHWEYVFMCNTLTCNSRAKLMPFNKESSLAKLICWVLLSSHYQQNHLLVMSCTSPPPPFWLLGNRCHLQFLTIYAPNPMG